MLLQKKGLPEEGELLLCTITKIQLNSVFVRIDEYQISGMIHISEISPGRIRNIRDFVKEGKKVVCVVLRVNTERGHVDLSLRRVNEAQRKKKVEYIKQQQKAEKIIEFVAKNNSIGTRQLFDEVTSKISKDYDDLVSFFSDIVNAGVQIADYNINPKYSKQIEELVRQRIKPPEVDVQGVFTIECYNDDGVETIRKAFSKIDSSVNSYYAGGGKYSINIKSSNYKDAEEHLEKLKKHITEFLEEHDCNVAFQRINKKK